MTVKQWKKCIAIFVIALIVLLTASTIFLALKAFKPDTDGDAVTASSEQSEDIQDDDKFLLNIHEKLYGENLEYQNKYKNLYVENSFSFKERESKVCYLTFDDGPSLTNTERILDILAEYDIKATFFVINHKGDEFDDLYRRIVREGHTIGIHSYSHDYKKIYESVDAFLADFNRISSKIEKLTGVKPNIFRFPGGSINTYNTDIYIPLAAEMLRRGYVYYDWNVGSGDAGYTYVSKKEICNNVLNGMYKDGESIVLMHDSKDKNTTVEALPDIIEKLLSQGYKFKELDNDVKPIVFNFLE